MWEQIKKLFDNEVIVGLGAAWAWVITFIFPTASIKTAAGAVLILMGLDLITKIFALAKQNGGIKKALRMHKINSNRFAKGTLDKLIIFGVMLIIGGCAYNLMLIKDIAIWFTQAVFSIMFLRDVLSIIENLNDAGVQGLGLFRKLVKSKLDEIVETDQNKEEEIQMKNIYEQNMDDELKNVLSDEEELSCETFEELSNGKGDDDDE